MQNPDISRLMGNKYMDEEIDLRDYINVLIKWKWLIIWITILSMLISGIASYFIIKPTYRGEANLLLPKVGDKLFFSPKEADILLTGGNVKNAIANKINIPYNAIAEGLTITTDESSGLVSITFENSDKEKIEEFFDAFVPVLNEKIASSYNEKLKLLKSKLLSLKEQLKRIENLEESLKKMLVNVEEEGKSNVNLLEYSLNLNTYNSLLKERNAIENEISDLELQINESHNFLYLGEPFVSNTPVKPKKLFNIAVSGVAAFFFAVLLAFFLEYWTNSDDKQKGGLKKKYEK